MRNFWTFLNLDWVESRLQPARKKLQPARKQFQPAGTRLQPARIVTPASQNGVPPRYLRLGALGLNAVIQLHRSIPVHFTTNLRLGARQEETPASQEETPASQEETPASQEKSPRTSRLTPHTSHLTPHTSHLTPHTSHWTRLRKVEKSQLLSTCLHCQ